jgi:multiple sugar transport system permease protein
MAIVAHSHRPTRFTIRRKSVEGIASYVALAFFMVLALFPVFWMLMTSVKDDYDLVDPKLTPFWFNRPLTLEHYAYLFTATKFTQWLGNTLLISTCVVIITLAVCIPGAYALARLRFFGAENLGIGIFLTYIVPPPTILFLPLARIVATAGLYNSKFG